MADAWKIVAEVSKTEARAALVAHEEALDWPAEWVVTGMEVADHLPDDWTVEVYLDREPGPDDLQRVAALFAGTPPRLSAEKLPATDWVTESQKGVEPIRAGRFHVRTPEHPADPGLVGFVIPALHLWPGARATASDIDPVCAGVVRDNMARNAIAEGGGPGQLTMVIADGMADPLLRLRGPYDLFIANILAGPLVELAPAFAAATAPGGNLLLAGLLETQEARVRRAYRAQGFRLARRLVRGDWSILWLRKSRVR